MISVPMTVSSSRQTIPVSVSCNEKTVQAAIGASYHMGKDAPYTGPYQFTPSAQRQVIPTARTAVDKDIIIDPIHSNYGLVTYNGSFITVS